MTGTIAAISTARGRAGVAVLRVSGPEAWAVGEALAGSLPEPGRAGVRVLRRPSGEVLDEALVLAFAEGRSFTGEAVVEFQVHGGLAVQQEVLRAILAVEGVRAAEPGEFTRRALEAGRLDLAQVEGLADLIDAETEAQRRQAVRSMRGALGDAAARWRVELVEVSALLAAAIDFADEELPGDVLDGVVGRLESVIADLRSQLAGATASERIRDGFEVAILGAPNAGKSTLLNRLAGREAALTSSVAGTTRDVIEIRMDIGGLAVTLLDTAGLREAADEVERMGVARARARAASADMRVFLLGPGEVGDASLWRDGDLAVIGKADVVGDGEGLRISGVTGQGIPELVRAIGQELDGRVQGSAVLTRERHRVAVERAVAALDSASEVLRMGQDQVDLAAEDVARAVRALDSLIGRVDVEALLDDIFSRFCLGK